MAGRVRRCKGCGCFGMPAVVWASLVLTGCTPEPDCDIEHELPIVTHWNSSSNTQQYLAADQISYELPYVPGSCSYRYKIGADYFLPNLNQYIATNYSEFKISDTQAKSVADAACAEYGVKVKFLRPDALAGGRIETAPGYLQIVHGIIVKSAPDDPGSLVTVFLPPNWIASNGNYPIVGSSNYDLNSQVFGVIGDDMIRLVIASSESNRTGAIGFIWNGGASRAGFTFNERAYHQFSAIVDLLSANFGGDRHKLFLYGTSRGGSTSLNMASNPYSHDYVVKRVIASALPVKIGELIETWGFTYPVGFRNLSWAAGLHDIWRLNWIYPAGCGINAHFFGRPIQEVVSYIMTGEYDRSVVDSSHSAISDNFIQGLKNAGTELDLTIGGHDQLNYSHQVSYVTKLVDNGIPVHVDIVSRAGHGALDKTSRSNKVWAAIQPHVDSSVTVQPIITAIDHYKVNYSTGAIEQYTPDNNLFPFTMDAPYVLYSGHSFLIVMTGEPGTEYSLEIINTVGGGLLHGLSGQIPTCTPGACPMYKNEWVLDTHAWATGVYYYKLRIRKPSGVWKDLDSNNTPSHSRELAVLNVYNLASEPEIGADSLYEAIFNMMPHHPGFYYTSWGIAEY